MKLNTYPLLRRLALISILFTAVFIFSNNSTFLPPPTSGYTEANVSVGENGESRVNIPVAVPKGTILAPELAIGYSSQSANGLLGQGFQLEGLYAISRQGANNAQDGFIDGVDFDNNDRFALNGERLVRIAGPAYGGNNTEYRTEQNNFSRVRSYGAAGIGPSYFKVWTKSGLVMEFGNGNNSKIEAQGRSEVLTWMVNKISDTKGNYITFTYIEENAKGEFRIDKIEYTGNASMGLAPYNLIQFNYESRPDSTVSYLSGSKIGLSKRLKEIMVQDNGVQYRRYDFTYFPATDLSLGGKSFLSSVQEFGVGNIGFPATTFKWTGRNVFGTQENTFATAYESFKDHPDRIRIGDVTGDGKMDVVLGPHPTNHEIYVLRSTGSSFVQEFWGTAPTWQVDQRAVRMMDINGDGKMDMMGGPLPNGKWEVKLSQGNSFSATMAWHPGIHAGYYHINHLNNVRSLDMDGDGLQDILLGPTEYGDWPWLRNNGIAFVDMGNAVAGLHGFFAGYWDKIHVSDATGDGLSDIVIGPHSDGNWFVIKNTGGALMDAGIWLNSPYSAWFSATDRVWQMDFNGDGLEEFVLGPDGDGRWYALRNKGTGYEDLGTVATGLYGSWHNKANRIRPMDLNGDGLTDFLFGPEQTTGNWYCMYNTGKGFELGYDNGYWLYGYSPGYFFESWWDNTNLTRQMDMNGDGVFDICFGPEPGTGKWEMMGNRISENHPHLLESVTNGHGATTSLVYEELTRPDVYQKGTGAVFPKMDFIAPLYVVTQVRSDNGIGGTNTIHYKYFDAKLDLSGRGFRGFGKTEQIDSLRGTKNVVIFERQHQYLSTKVGATEQWLLNYNGSPKLLHSTETTLDTFEYFSEKVHFSYVENSTEKWYDLNSASPFKTMVTSTVFDRNWGDVTQMTEEHKVGTTTQYTVVTNNTYAAPDTLGNKWILGRLTQASVTKTFAGKPSITKQSTFDYDAASGLLTQEKLNATSSTLFLQKDYSLDAYGNRLMETVSGPGITSRTTTFTYDTQGRLMTKVKNPLNQESNFTYQNGLPQSMTDPNGLGESTTRDAFGRPTTVFHPDGTQTSKLYYKCDGTQLDCPQFGVHFVETEKAGNGKTRTFYDLLDREVRKVDYGLDGQVFYTDTEYDEKGLVARKSDAYRDEPTWHLFEYDVLFRLVKETAPGNLISTMAYAGLTTTSTNAESQNAVRITNSMGWLLQAKDNQNNTLNYDYDSDGNMTKVTDPAGNMTSLTYDSRGNKTSMDDPDLGFLTYEYNTLGLLTKQTYGGGQNIIITYDILDRKTRQVEKKNASTIERTLGWKYDLGNKGIGRITADSINGTVSKQYVYDNIGRVSEEKEKIEGVDYSTVYEYDASGRIRFLNYPGVADFKLRYDYDTYGHLKSICQPNTTNGNCAAIFWQADSLNNRGQLTKFTLGNGLSTRKTYDPNTGYLLGIKTGNATDPISVQNLSYQFSPLGNLTQRKDLKPDLAEDFQYDNLNRLTQSQVVGQSAVTVQYNAIGNILFKSNVGTYTYGQNGEGPHMVTSIDHSGIPNCFYGFQGTVGYTVYNYPQQITNSLDTINFTYDAGRMKQTQRFVKNGVLKWKKRYINSLTEYVQEGGINKTVLHIKAMGETVAILKKQTGAPDTLRYMHHDHLGSLQAISTELGSLVSTYSYDPWGKPRSSTTWQPILNQSPPPPYERGFTGHEMMGIEDLVHMNARLYDPAIGRFCSADPFVQMPDDLQSYNRASYVLNNPLSYTDPTGFFFRGLRKFLKENVQTVVSVAIAAVAIIAAVPTAGGSLSLFGLSGFYTAVVSGAAAGFGGAFVATLDSGGGLGDAFRNGLVGGAIGGLSAGLTYGVGSLFQSLAKEGILNGFGNLAAKSLTHGVVQGGISELSGGDFKDGFLSGFASSITSGLTNGKGDIFGRTLASAIVGGTVSKLTGGKFANGAATAAFVHLFNSELHDAVAREDRIKITKHFADHASLIFGLAATIPTPLSPIFAGLSLIATGVSMYSIYESSQPQRGTSILYNTGNLAASTFLDYDSERYFNKGDFDKGFKAQDAGRFLGLIGGIELIVEDYKALNKQN